MIIKGFLSINDVNQLLKIGGSAYLAPREIPGAKIVQAEFDICDDGFRIDIDKTGILVTRRGYTSD